VPKNTAGKRPNALVRFFQETWGEMRKVTWPTWDEAIRLTAVVMAVLIAASLFLGSIDLLLSEVFARALAG
jgi:preprotein translocase subunit SecE